MALVEQILSGDRLALAKAITGVEQDAETGREFVDQLFSHTGKGHVLGITGPSGAGKSTLVNALIKFWLQRFPEAEIGVIAVDPTSPFSGGALLGDRVRMRDIVRNERVFVRSMATRGALGGLSLAVPAVIQIMDAARFDPIIVETVGAGQTEVEIASLAHTTIVVEAPGLGDDVQALKAGILEIADILVVNKADLSGADLVVKSLQAMLELGYPPPVNQLQANRFNGWVPPVLSTVATGEMGIKELLVQVQKHKEIILENGQWQKKDRQRLESWLKSLYAEKIGSQWKQVIASKTYAELLALLLSRQLSPYQVLNQLLKLKPPETN